VQDAQNAAVAAGAERAAHLVQRVRGVVDNHLQSNPVIEGPFDRYDPRVM